MKLLSLNIELDRHLERIIPFLRIERPDVICLQELLFKDIPFLERELDMQCLYEPLCDWKLPERTVRRGVGIFSRHSMTDVRKDYYAGGPERIPEHITRHPETVNHAVLSAQIGGVRIATTHFTWTPDEKPTELQRDHFEKLLAVLGSYEEILLCGDFNTPRGGELFDRLAAAYQDWVPQEYTTSIDGKFHRAGQLNLMVDGLFSTRHYKAMNVRMIDGLSDHRAIAAEISRIA